MFCPQCGAPNEEDAAYCGNCGIVLKPEQVPPLVEQDMPNQRAVGTEPREPEFLPPDEPQDSTPLSSAIPPRSPVPGSGSQTSGMAIASLIMGIVGWTVLPIIGSALAIIFGYMARNEIRQRPTELSGDGLALAGLVLGWLMVGTSVLLLCLGGLGFCFFFGFMGAASH